MSNSGWKSSVLKTSRFILKWMNKISVQIQTYLEKKVDTQKRKFQLEHGVEMNEQEIREYRYQLVMQHLIPAAIVLIVLIFVGRGMLAK